MAETSGELPDVDPEQEALIRAEVEEELQLSVEELEKYTQMMAQVQERLTQLKK